MHAIKRTSRRGAPRVYYVCNGWRVNGTCTNSWSLPLVDLDAAVLEALREDILTPDLVGDMVARALELRAAEHDGIAGRRRALETDLRKVETETPAPGRSHRRRRPPALSARRHARPGTSARGTSGSA